MVKKRNAITLFITLAVIVALLALVGIVFGYLSKARAKAQDKAALIQANVIYADASNTLAKYLGKKPSNGILKQIYSIPVAIKESKGSFNMMLACAPSHAAVPIVWLKEPTAKSQDKFSVASILFDKIALEANIKDPQYLLKLIQDAIASKQQIKFGVESRLQRRENFLSYSNFLAILNEYNLQKGDANVYKARWRDFYSFGEGYEKIDSNYLSADLVSYLFDIDKQIVQEGFTDNNLKKFLYDNGADMELFNSKVFSKGVVVAMRCTINYAFGKGYYSFDFDYTKGKVHGFEFQK